MAKKDRPAKVLVLLGSPRKHGNSALLAEAIAKGAKACGAEVETVFIQDRKIAACTSCYHCQKKGGKGCSIKDDMQGLYKKLIEAQAWVIASPVYWFSMSAQTKLWMDRLFALPAYAKHPFAGKRIAVAMSYGGADPFDSGCINALRTFQDAFSYTESTLVGMVYGSAMEAGEIKANKSLMKAAEELGRKLVAA
ncbi:MAG TPA: flavodoxin family protein [Deltaproteobacteria bacterium]|nr:flavodoxin family protein [Deltaproteobacteria bacterium]